MTVQMTATIILNPATEFRVIEQYKQDKGYRLMKDCTAFTTFECSTPQYECDAMYMPSRKERE